MFTVEGEIPEIGGLHKVVWYDDGSIDTDRAASLLVRAQVGQRIALTPTGPSIVGRLDKPKPALATIGSLFTRGYVASGDVPDGYELPELPAGAIP